MEKETKNIITRDSVEEELRFYNNEDIRANLAYCGLLGFPFSLATFAGICAIFAIIEIIWAKFLASALLCAIMSIPAKKIFLPLINNLKEKKALNRGDFVIITRKLADKSVKSDNNKSTELFHFSGFKEIEAWHDVFANACEEDEFYIVHYRKQDSIKLVYPTKTHEYKER